MKRCEREADEATAAPSPHSLQSHVYSSVAQSPSQFSIERHKQACFFHGMRPLSLTVSSTKRKESQLQCRIDVRAEMQLFAACLLHLRAFQSNKMRLQAIFHSRPSPPHFTAAHGRAFGFRFGVKQRQGFVACSSLCMTLVTRLIVFKRTHAVKHVLRTATCILSRRQVPRGRLGGVAAAAGSGFVCTIGTKGAGHGQFHDPSGGVAFDGDGNLVVSDYNNHRIQVLRYSDGAHLRTIGCKDEWNGWGRQDGRFIQPWGVAFDGAGHIIVSEYGSRRVQILRYSNGAHVRYIRMICPSGIAVDGEGNIAVFDSSQYGGEACVQVFRLSDGTHLRSIGSAGSGNGQFAGGCCGIAFDGEGNLVVADCGNDRVQVLRYSDGAHLRTISSERSGTGQFNQPLGVAFDAAGHIVIVERGSNCVQVLRYSDGAHVRTIGKRGAALGKLNGPFGGIAIDSDGRIVVADTDNCRVQVFA
jgi:DNA-binding beta-propeller fold protein YncE